MGENKNNTTIDKFKGWMEAVYNRRYRKSGEEVREC